MKTFFKIIIVTTLIIGTFLFISTFQETKETQKEVADTTTQPLDQAHTAKDQTTDSEEKMRDAVNKEAGLSE